MGIAVGVLVSVAVAVLVGVLVDVLVGVFVAVAVAVGVGVIVGPNNCPGPQPEINKPTRPAINEPTTTVRCLCSLSLCTITGAPDDLSNKIHGFEVALQAPQRLSMKKL